MANRKVRLVRSVKLHGKWKFLSLERGRKLKIPDSEGRWYISWREGRRTRWKLCKDHSDAIRQSGTKHAELHATAWGIKITPDDPKRLRLADAIQQFIDDLELRARHERTIATEIALTGTGPDQDDYVYDPNTGRMTKFTFQVGNTPATMVGQVNWNPNGTLNNLAITDGFNSGGTQTCDFNPSSGSGMGYDDLGRLLNVSCGSSGSIWNQAFSYDQYDNLTKSSTGPGISWNPGYSSTTNQYTLSGTSYDLSGNLLNDTFHTYTWNPFSKVASLDSTACGTNGECITYDALGRAVEISKNSAYTEIWYTQLGKTAYMNGSTYSYAYFPTPGGGTVDLAGNCPSDCNIDYMHKIG